MLNKGYVLLVCVVIPRKGSVFFRSDADFDHPGGCTDGAALVDIGIMTDVKDPNMANMKCKVKRESPKSIDLNSQ